MRGEVVLRVPLVRSVVKCDGVLGGDGLVSSVMMSILFADLEDAFVDLTCSMAQFESAHCIKDCVYLRWKQREVEGMRQRSNRVD